MVAYLKTQSVLELLNNFSNLSTVAYKGVAYKKNRVPLDKSYFTLNDMFTEIFTKKHYTNVIYVELQDMVLAGPTDYELMELKRTKEKEQGKNISK